MRTLLALFFMFATTVISTGQAISADMIQGYERPHVVKQRSTPIVRARYVERRHLDCTDMIVEYRYIPRTEFVTVCHRL